MKKKLKKGVGGRQLDGAVHAKYYSYQQPRTAWYLTDLESCFTKILIQPGVSVNLSCVSASPEMRLPRLTSHQAALCYTGNAIPPFLYLLSYLLTGTLSQSGQAGFNEIISSPVSCETNLPSLISRCLKGQAC